MKNKLDTPLLNALLAYNGTGRLRFHVPGHNGHNLAKSHSADILPDKLFEYDLTELEGLDVLSEPESCLMQSQRETAKAFGTEYSFYLVNGASVGIMATMLSILSPSDKVLLPRNTHRSVISGLVQTGATPVWCLPEYSEETGLWGAMSPDVIETHLEQHPGIRLVMITSPTYEGIGSDIGSILRVCRKHGTKLAVDEAHGSLWPFSEQLPISACHFPCDIVIHSLHKTAGSLTQGALAHLPAGSTVSPQRFQQALNMLQTTSPSYLLLASLEATRAYLVSTEGQAAIRHLLEKSDWLRRKLQEECSNFQIHVPGNKAFWDPTKLWIQHRRWAGTDWAVLLEAQYSPFAIAYESATPEGALYLCGLGLEAKDYQEFLDIFSAWDKRQEVNIKQKPAIDHAHAQGKHSFHLPDMAMPPREAFFSPGTQLPKEECLGRISRQTVVHCPPGIPVLFPGERVSESHLAQLPDVLEVCQASCPAAASPASTSPIHPQTPVT